MIRIMHFAVQSLMTLPRYSDIAVADVTDAELRRAGLSKAEILHRKLSGLHAG